MLKHKLEELKRQRERLEAYAAAHQSEATIPDTATSSVEEIAGNELAQVSQSTTQTVVIPEDFFVPALPAAPVTEVAEEVASITPGSLILSAYHHASTAGNGIASAVGQTQLSSQTIEAAVQTAVAGVAQATDLRDRTRRNMGSTYSTAAVVGLVLAAAATGGAVGFLMGHSNPPPPASTNSVSVEVLGKEIMKFVFTKK